MRDCENASIFLVSPVPAYTLGREQALLDLVFIQRLHAGMPVVHLSHQLEVPPVSPLQVGLHLVPLPTRLVRQDPGNTPQTRLGVKPGRTHTGCTTPFAGWREPYHSMEYQEYHG